MSTLQQKEQKFDEAVASNEKKVNEAYDKVSSTAQDELTKVKAEFDEFKKRSAPKVQEAENFLTSPSAIGFYQGKLYIYIYEKIMCIHTIFIRSCCWCICCFGLCKVQRWLNSLNIIFYAYYSCYLIS